MKGLRTIISILLLFIGNAYSQDLYFDHLTVEDGLSQAAISAIIQDTNGFIWVGTRDGLNRFDATEFKIYKNIYGDSSTLTNNVIRSLDVDKKGRLWVGTANDLALYDPRRNSFQSFSIPLEGKGNNFVRQVKAMANGKVWVATTGGIFVFDPNNFQFGPQLIKGVEVQDLVQYNHRVLVGTNSGLLIVNPDNPDDIIRETSLEGLTITSIFVDSKDNPWVGTGVGLYSKKAGEDAYSLKTPWDQRRIYDIEELSDRIIYSCGFLTELNLKTGDYHTYSYNPLNSKSISRDNISTLYVDKSGILWSGSNGYGLNIYDPSKNFFHLIQNSPSVKGIPNNYVSAIAVDSNNCIWIGTSGGLCKYNSLTYQFDYFLPSNAIIPGIGLQIRALYYEEEELWIGGLGTGLICYNLKSKTTKRWLDGTESADENRISVISIKKARDGKIWAGTQGDGLFVLDESRSQIERISFEGEINSLVEDHLGYVWAGTNKGLLKVDPSTFAQQLIEAESKGLRLSSNNILGLLEDSNHKLWVGTWGGGVNLLQDDKFQYIKTENGLPDNVVYGFVEDDAGYIWMSTNYGLARYNPVAGSFVKFTSKDGLQGNEFNTGAYYKDHNGRIFFGGINGLTFFDPRTIRTNWNPPNTVITDFELFNHSKSWEEISDGLFNKELFLAHTQNSFSVNFVSLNFTNSFRNQYQIRLSPFESEWRDLGNEDFAHYTNISPGDYELQVRGSNNDLVWDPSPATLGIYIAPPWYLTWWAKTFFIVAFISMVLVGHRFRLRYYKRSKLRLEKEVQSRTEEALYKSQLVEEYNNKLIEQTHQLKEINSTLEEKVNERTREIQESHAQLELKNLDLEKANEELDRFVYSVSHQLRAPLVSVLGLINIAREESFGSSVSQYLDLIQKSINRLDESIREINDHARNTRLEVKTELIDFSEILEDVIQSMEYLESSRQVKINSHIEQKVDFFADKVRLNIILSNLVSNGYKYFDPSKENSVLDIDIKVDEKGAHIVFVDNGIGIPVEQHDKIFKIFYRASEKGYGSGLGLYIVREILKKLNGEIIIESEEGKYSKFSVFIPSSPAGKEMRKESGSREVEKVANKSKV